MIKHLTVQNYRALRDLTVDLSSLTVLVGPNGVGKSTTLEALHYITLMSYGGNTEARTSWDGDYPSNAHVRISNEQASFEYPTPNKEVKQREAIWTIDGTEFRANLKRSPNAKISEFPPSFPTSVIRLHLDPKILRADSTSHSPLPLGHIGVLGQGLAAALNDFKTNDDPRFDAIMQAMRHIVPGLKGIKAPRVPQQPGNFTISCATAAHHDIPARHMSDGTLYALALITALSSNQGRPTLVLLDDIDQGLHPKAQSELITQIRAIQKNDPGLQVIATCHSPYLVDSLEGDEVVLMQAGKDGFARARRLSDHPDYKRLHGALGTGEFWGSVGEMWVTDEMSPKVETP